MTTSEPTLTSYAGKRLFQRQIPIALAIQTAMHGEVIQQHRTDTPNPSRTHRLEVSFTGPDGVTRPRVLHIVAVEDVDGSTKIITGWWPDVHPEQWDADFRTRRQV
jgi:uncharacterized protein (DUF2235 family)